MLRYWEASNVFVHLGSWVAGWWWSWLMSMLLQNRLLKKDEKLNWCAYNHPPYWLLITFQTSSLLHIRKQKSLSHFFLALGKVLKIWDSLCEERYSFYWWIIVFMNMGKIWNTKNLCDFNNSISKYEYWMY